jgi:hypothetical protein
MTKENAVAVREPEQLPAQSETAQLMGLIERALVNPEITPEKMQGVLDVMERIKAGQAEQAFSEAMNEVQKKIEPIATDAANPQTQSRYASYAALDRALRPIYIAHGFEVSFDTADSTKPDHILVICTVAHKAGHKRSHRADMPVDGKGAKGGSVMTSTHAVGSGIQYGKRYTLGMAFNVAVAKDDDGNAAGARISDEQLQELIELADQLGVDKQAYCEHFGLAGLADILAKDFAKAKTAMLAKGKASKK